MSTAQQDERPIPEPPPAGKRAPSAPLFTPLELLQGWTVSGGGILPASSVAYRDNPQFAQMMRLDPSVEGPLRNLRVTLAQLPWGIEAEPTARKDARVQAFQRRVAEQVGRIPRLTDLFYALHVAKWAGLGVVNLIYDTPTSVADWTALDPDSMAFDKVGNIGVKVGSKYLANGGVGMVTTGFQGFVRVLDAMERDSVVVHRVFCEAPDFLSQYSAELAYRGRGARDTCWYYWQIKQQVLRAAVAFANTYAQGGIRKGWYPSGDTAAQQTMLGILTRLDQIGSVALPFDVGTPASEQPWGMDLLSMPSGTGDIYLSMLEYLDRKIKEAIVGQSLSSEAAGTGLGSGVAAFQADTLANELRYNAGAVAESLTRDLVRVLARRMGASDDEANALRFAVTVQQQDVEGYMKGVEAFLRVGGSVPADAVRDRLGLPKAEPDEATLTAPAAPDLGGLAGVEAAAFAQ